MVVVLVGGLFLAMMRHGAVHRDRYRSLEDCQRDWATVSGASAQCQRSSVRGSYVYLGPSYEEDARPKTGAIESRLGSERISRGGFGRSGARFSAGG